MFPYLSQSGIPVQQDRIEQNRPPSHLEVYQYDLEHKRRRRLQLLLDSQQPSLIPPGDMVRRVRHSVGYLLIGLGRWMTNGTAAPGTRPELLARR